MKPLFFPCKAIIAAGIFLLLVFLGGCLGKDPQIVKDSRDSWQDIIPNVINSNRILIDGQYSDWSGVLPTVQDKAEGLFEWNEEISPAVDIQEIRKKVDEVFVSYMFRMFNDQPPVLDSSASGNPSFSIWIYYDITPLRLTTLAVSGVPVTADAALIIGGTQGTVYFVALDDQGKPIDTPSGSYQHQKILIKTDRVIELRLELQEIVDNWQDRNASPVLRIRELAVEIRTAADINDNVGFGDVYDNGIVHDGTYEIPGR